MKTPHVHAALIKEWAEGAEIESQVFDGEWYNDYQPAWAMDINYRIKPEPKRDVVTECKILGIYKSILWNSVTNTTPDANLRLTYDGVTGKLKAAEVL